MENFLQKLKGVQKPSGQLQTVLIKKLQGNYLKDLSEAEIGSLLQKLYIIIGVSEQNVLKGNENLLLIKTIKESFSNWTKQEIIYAFELAIKGQLINVELNLYDKPFNNWYLSQILNQYKRQFRSKTLVKHNQQVMDENEQKELTAAQKQQIIIDGVLNCFETYKKEKNIVDFNNVTCRYLINIKLIQWNEQQIKELKEKTKELRKQELINFKEESTSKETRKYFNELLLNFDKNIETSKTSKANLNRIYYNLSLEKYFNELIEFELDLKGLIMNKLK